jgi:sulfatase maturation enzyme AslB (radical SAM superfamily)
MSLLAATLGELDVDDALIERGLEAGARSRDLAIELAGRHLALGASHLVKMWLAVPEKREAIKPKLVEDPLLVLERRPDREIGPWSPAGPEVQRWFSRLRIERLMEALRTARSSGDVSALCKGLPGLHQLAFSSESPLPEATRARLKDEFAERLGRRFPKQLSVIPSYYCDRTCSYCFNRAPHKSDLTLEKFQTILDRAAPAGDLTRVNLFGGEPTLFEGFFEFAEELERRRLRFFFSTHGIIDNDRFARIAAMANLEMVTFHVEKPPFYAAGEYEMLLRNIRAVARSGRQVVIRYNLVEAEHRDWKFLAPFFQEAPNAPFSFAVVFPSPNGRNRHAPIGDLRRYAAKMVALVRHLESEFPDIPRLVLSKPFPLCAFSDRDLRYMLRRVDYRNICEIDRNGFTDQVQVTPNLEVIPCMAMGAPQFRLPEVTSLEDMGRQFEKLIAPVLAQPMLGACKHCSLFSGGACQAACFSYAAHPEAPPAETSSANRRLKVLS